MGYTKAHEVLPENLISVIQEYIDGEYLYIPRRKGNEKSWGEASGTKVDLENRNREIFTKFNSGSKVDTLADYYYLSEKTIRKIISNQKKQK